MIGAGRRPGTPFLMLARRANRKACLISPTTNVSVTSDVSLVRLLRIQMSNLFFTLVTVGAYRFWGLTRLRRTIWDAVSLSGSRLIYRGSGLELFISTLAALVVLLLPVTMIWGTLIWVPIGSWLFVGTCLSALLCLFMLHFVGRFYRARYLAERTIWRGVRGGLRGNALQYALVALWQGFLVILTAGLWWPRMQMRLSGYLVSNASLGNFNPKWVEQRSGLFSAWLLAWSVGLFAIVCGLGWMSFRVAGPESGDGLGFAEPLLLTASLISGFACFLLFCAYQVALVRAKAVSLSLDDLFVFSAFRFHTLFGSMRASFWCKRSYLCWSVFWLCCCIALGRHGLRICPRLSGKCLQANPWYRTRP